MIWMPSPRPPWSEWLMNLTLRDATAFMALLYPFALPLVIASAARQRRGSGPWSSCGMRVSFRINDDPVRFDLEARLHLAYCLRPTLECGGRRLGPATP